MFRIVIVVSAIVLIPGYANPAFGQSSTPIASAPSKAADTAPVNPAVVPDTSDDRVPADSFIAVDSQPEMTYQMPPKYPKADMQAGTTGKVWVKLLVNRQGLPRKAVVLKLEQGATDAMGKSAVEAAMQNRFQPAKVKGKPVACWVTYAVSFRLSDKQPTDSSSTKGSDKPAPKK